MQEYLKTSNRKIQVDETLGERPLLMLGKQCDDNQFLAMLSKFCPHRITRSGEVMTISAKPLPQDLDFQRVTESLLPETLRRYIFAPSIKNKISVFPMDRTAILPPAYGEAVEKEIIGELQKNTVPFTKLSAFQRRCVMLRLLNPIVEGMVLKGGSVPNYVLQRNQLLIIVFVKSIGLEVLSSNEATLARSSTTHYIRLRHRRKPTIRRRQICRFAL